MILVNNLTESQFFILLYQIAALFLCIFFLCSYIDVLFCLLCIAELYVLLTVHPGMNLVNNKIEAEFFVLQVGYLQRKDHVFGLSINFIPKIILPI